MRPTVKPLVLFLVGFCPAPKSASGLRQVSTSQLGAHTGALEAGFGGRSCRNFVRSPGPATTYQGHAQVMIENDTSSVSEHILPGAQRPKGFKLNIGPRQSPT